FNPQTFRLQQTEKFDIFQSLSCGAIAQFCSQRPVSSNSVISLREARGGVQDNVRLLVTPQRSDKQYSRARISGTPPIRNEEIRVDAGRNYFALQSIFAMETLLH